MTNEELQQLVEDISIEYFQIPFLHKAVFNPRLRTTGGRYFLRSHHLDFNPMQLEHFGREAFIKIIKHELCHYHLHLQKKGYRHIDADFKRLLAEVGGSRYCSLIPGTENKRFSYHHYQCQSCELMYRRKRRMNTKKYVCGKCGGKLNYKTLKET